MEWSTRDQPLFDVRAKFNQSLRQARISRGEPPEGGAHGLRRWAAERSRRSDRDWVIGAVAVLGAVGGFIAFNLLKRDRAEEAALEKEASAIDEAIQAV